MKDSIQQSVLAPEVEESPGGTGSGGRLVLDLSPPRDSNQEGWENPAWSMPGGRTCTAKAFQTANKQPGKEMDRRRGVPNNRGHLEARQRRGIEEWAFAESSI